MKGSRRGAPCLQHRLEETRWSPAQAQSGTSPVETGARPPGPDREEGFEGNEVPPPLWLSGKGRASLEEGGE